MLQNERMQKRPHLYSVKKQFKRVFLHPLAPKCGHISNTFPNARVRIPRSVFYHRKSNALSYFNTKRYFLWHTKTGDFCL